MLSIQSESTQEVNLTNLPYLGLTYKEIKRPGYNGLIRKKLLGLRHNALGAREPTRA